MIYLDDKAVPGDGTGTAWLELPEGVRVEVRPLSTSIAEAAANAARKAGAAMAAKAEEAEKLGVPLDPLGPNEANASWVQGKVFELQIFHLASFGIVAWEGIGDRQGVPLPVEPPALQAFAAHPIAGPAFLGAYYATLERKVEEGNVSAGSSDGNLGEQSARDTAAPARPAEPAAETTAASAPAS